MPIHRIEGYNHEEEMRMPHRTPPDNDHDVGIALWHAVIGLNGGGLITSMKEVRTDMKSLMDGQADFVTKGECVNVQAVPARKRRSRWLMIKDIVLILSALVGMIAGAVGAMLATGIIHIGV